MLIDCEDTVSLSVDASAGYRRSATDIRKAGLVFHLIEITGRLDSETVCTAEGIEYDRYVVCDNDTWIYITPIRETDKNPIVNAGRKCLNVIREDIGETLFTLEDETIPAYEPCDAFTYRFFCPVIPSDATTSASESCDAGWIARADSSGSWCYFLPECGSSLTAIYVPESDSYECSETYIAASQFWEYAFDTINIRSDYWKARWIGGLATSYNKNIWREYTAMPEQDYEGGLYVWDYQNRASAEEHMEYIAEGTSHVHICYEHDCEKPGNLIGSTDISVSSCLAIVWHTEAGLWFLMRIDESVPVCVRAFEKVASGEINGASVGYSSSYIDTGRTAPKDEIERPVYYEYYVEFNEITLSQSSKDGAPADNHTWVAAIDWRE